MIKKHVLVLSPVVAFLLGVFGGACAQKDDSALNAYKAALLAANSGGNTNFVTSTNTNLQNVTVTQTGTVTSTGTR